MSAPVPGNESRALTLTLVDEIDLEAVVSFLLLLSFSFPFQPLPLFSGLVVMGQGSQ